jgi:hypothetical protein
MKTNIRKVGIWWKWDEYCDICSKQTRDENVLSNTEPEIGKNDYCVEWQKKN